MLFLTAGFGYACWAPLVPLTKHRLELDEHILGLLFLCIGLGSIAAMVATGFLTTRFSNRTLILSGGFGLAAIVAILPVANTVETMGLTLFAYGAMLGTLDISMNLHAVQVESAAGRPLMSGFHALFSIGAFAGSGLVTLLLSKGIDVLTGMLFCSGAMVIVLIFTAPKLLNTSNRTEGQSFALPRGLVLVIALLACSTLLVEGALLDWSALLIINAGLVPVAKGALGYMFFSVAMTVGRLSGDAVVARFGDYRTLVWGGIVGIAGFVVLLTAVSTFTALVGFVLIGLGCSNIIPVLFRRAAAQKSMPSGLAIAAVSTTAYAGMLAGPAGIGFVAEAASLHWAFWMLAALLVLVPVCAQVVTRDATSQD